MGLLDQLLRIAGKAVHDAASKSKKSFVFDKVPETLDEFKNLPEASMTDYMAVPALAVLALMNIDKDIETCFSMIDFLLGPESISEYQKQFLRERRELGYVFRSYFEGSKKENDYTPTEPLKITVYDEVHSHDSEKDGYLDLYLKSSGADSKRPVRIRKKPSTGQWFIVQYQGILADIRTPQSEDKWA